MSGGAAMSGRELTTWPEVVAFLGIWGLTLGFFLALIWIGAHYGSK